MASIKPSDPDSFYFLEQAIKRDGVIEPLIVSEIGGKQVLLDGHRRLELIRKYNIKNFKIVILDIPTIDMARWFIVEHSHTFRCLNVGLL